MTQENILPLPKIKRIFCCGHVEHIITQRNTKLHNDPNRELHDAILHSFLAYNSRRQRSADFMTLLFGCDRAGLSALISEKPDPLMLPPAPEPIFTPELLKNNPLKPQTPYVIHLTARHDFGAVYSHRYFVIPSSLEQDWVEISLLEWFVAGEAFKLQAEKWDMKCTEDNTFFRMTLRPNLAMRGCYPVGKPQKPTEAELM